MLGVALGSTQETTWIPGVEPCPSARKVYTQPVVTSALDLNDFLSIQKSRGINSGVEAYVCRDQGLSLELAQSVPVDRNLFHPFHQL